MTTGRIATLRGYDRAIELEEYELPEPEPGGLILQMRQATICGSDLHVWRGETAQRGSPVALAFGHEGFGVVHALGEGTTTDNAGRPLNVGDRVIHHTSTPPRGRTPAPERAYGSWPYFITTFADYLYVSPDRAVYRVPDDLSDDALPTVNCAMGTAINALIGAGVGFGSRVVVYGAGALGLVAAAAAKDMGAACVIVLDRVPARLELASAFGADHTLNVDEVHTPSARVATVRELTGGHGADVVVELVGRAEILPEGVEMLAPGGAFAEIGLFFPGTTTAFDPFLVHGKRKRILGFSRYPDELIPKILAFMVRTRDTRPFERLISHKRPLAEIGDALAEADWLTRRPDVTRISLIP